MIETQRLVLRPHEVSDHADCAAMWRDRAVVRFIGRGEPHADDEIWGRLVRYAGCWRLLGYGYWAVRERTTGRFVGDVGFQTLRRPTEPLLPDLPEIGWVLAAWAQGQGYAREAVAAALSWADASLDAAATICIIHPDHRRSIRLAREAGYEPIDPVLLGSQPMDAFQRSRGFQTGAPITTS